ncbi:hypothetical protein ACKWMY_13460 [Serratia sp. J2]|uniref:hypothetical protein n=1 Tax=Serratia TaxID=613 RepID=UPI0004644E46|nr:hypothetical protein [Serratia fonticola]
MSKSSQIGSDRQGERRKRGGLTVYWPEGIGSHPWRHVYRTDIRGYYRHILKHQVAGQLKWHIEDTVCRDLCLQWLHYSIEDGGEIVTPEKEICRDSALIPLIGGSLLRHVDSYFSTREEIFYAR